VSSFYLHYKTLYVVSEDSLLGVVHLKLFYDSLSDGDEGHLLTLYRKCTLWFPWCWGSWTPWVTLLVSSFGRNRWLVSNNPTCLGCRRKSPPCTTILRSAVRLAIGRKCNPSTVYFCMWILDDKDSRSAFFWSSLRVCGSLWINEYLPITFRRSLFRAFTWSYSCSSNWSLVDTWFWDSKKLDTFAP